MFNWLFGDSKDIEKVRDRDDICADQYLTESKSLNDRVGTEYRSTYLLDLMQLCTGQQELIEALGARVKALEAK